MMAVLTFCLVSGATIQNNNTLINGYLKVGSINPDFTDNRVMASGGVVSHGGFSGKNSDYIPYIKLFDSASSVIKSGVNGSYDYDTNIFCDSVADNFTASDAQKPRKSIAITSGTHKGGVARVFEYYNSSCVGLKLNPGWSSDFGNTSWKLKTGLKINFNDGESYDFVIGNSEESVFKIGHPNSTAFTSLWLNDVSGANQHQGFTLDYEMGNYEGQVAQNIYMYSTEQMVDKTLTMMLLEGDASYMNSSDGIFIDMEIIGTPLTEDGEIDALQISPKVTHIIDMGSSDVLNASFYEDENITSNVTTSGLSANVFINDDEYVYFGSETNFSILSLALSTVSSANLDIEYFYCNSTSDWQVLDSITDTTNGLQVSGTITFTSPSNRGVCNSEYDGTPFSDSNNYTYVALKRTRNNVGTTPVIDSVSLSGGSSYFILQKDMMNLYPVDTAPETCDAVHLGALYFDISEDQFCQCTSGGWKEMDDAGADCT